MPDKKSTPTRADAPPEHAPPINKEEVIKDLQRADVFRHDVIDAPRTGQDFDELLDELKVKQDAAFFSGKPVQDASEREIVEAKHQAEDAQIVEIAGVSDLSDLTPAVQKVLRDFVQGKEIPQGSAAEKVLQDLAHHTNQTGEFPANGPAGAKAPADDDDDDNNTPRSGDGTNNGTTDPASGPQPPSDSGSPPKSDTQKDDGGAGTYHEHLTSEDGSASTTADATFHRDGQGNWTDQDGNPVPANTAARLEQERTSGQLTEETTKSDDTSNSSAGGGAQEQQGDPGDPDDDGTEHLDKLGGPLVEEHTISANFGSSHHPGGATDPSDSDDTQFGAGVTLVDHKSTLLGGDTFGTEGSPHLTTVDDGALHHDGGFVDPVDSGDSAPQLDGPDERDAAEPIPVVSHTSHTDPSTGDDVTPVSSLDHLLEQPHIVEAPDHLTNIDEHLEDG